MSLGERQHSELSLPDGSICGVAVAFIARGYVFRPVDAVTRSLCLVRASLLGVSVAEVAVPMSKLFAGLRR